jgi:hypothetical protein
MPHFRKNSGGSEEKMSYYIHSVPGRLRVKIPGIKGRAALCHGVEDVFSAYEGIDRVSANPATGSVVIHYDRHTTHPDNLFAILAEKGYFDRALAVRHSGASKGHFAHGGEAVRKALVGWLVGKALEPTGLSFLTALI